ncbi:MAG: serine protease, partial [Gammaproteobacteria bacterium]|nr:serine protease [Gammaproteobacteria bacterium]
MNKHYRQLAALAAVSFLATACGGGGGGGSPSTQPPPVEPPVVPAPELFRIAGTITASSSQAVDGDTNDPAGTVRANDTVATAQPIPNPITLGGYVNQPGSGA